MSEFRLLPRPLESALFGVSVHSATVRTLAEVERLLATAPSGLVVVRVACSAVAVVQRLESGGAQLCDTLLTMSRVVGVNDGASSSASAITVRLASAADATRLAELSGAAFRDFSGHWHTDGRLASHLADRLYSQWAADLARNTSDSRPVYLAQAGDGGPIGFLALSLTEDPNSWSVPLAAVDAHCRGQGVLPAMLDAAIGTIARNGPGRLDYETQLTNRAALRSVARHGLLPSDARFTFHLWTEHA